MSRSLPVDSGNATSAPDQKPRRINRIAIVGIEGYLREYTTTNYRMPRIGPVIVGSILNDAGYDVRIFAEAVHALDENALSFVLSSDLVAFSVLTYGANRAYELCRIIRRESPQTLLLMGDVHATIMPEHCLQHCDFVIRGEGDDPILELLSHLNGEAGAPALGLIDGLSFWDGERIVHNQRRARPRNINVAADLSLVETFAQPNLLTFLREKRHTLSVIQASRGCPVACKFCLGSAILGEEYRMRDIDHVLGTLRSIRRLGIAERPAVFFVDNHLFINKAWTKELLRRIIRERLQFAYIAFGQYFIGNDPEMLDLLREAGFMRIFVGFESINPETLKEYRKRQSKESMRKCIAAMHAHGVEVHGSFMLGGETDTEQTIDATIRFAIETDILTASFFALCEYPFEDHAFVPNTNMLPPHRLLPDNLDYYNLNFVSIYPNMMRPSTLQRGLISAYQQFYSASRVVQAISKGNNTRAYQRAVGLLGQRSMVDQMAAYLPYLEERERGKYDASGRLNEAALDRAPRIFQDPGKEHYQMLYRRWLKARSGEHQASQWGGGKGI